MPNRFSIKRLDDGRAMINLGCGTLMHRGWTNLDFSPSARLAHHPRIAAALKRTGLLSPKRAERLRGIDPTIVVWDLRRGIPFMDAAFDVVYHAHFLEHLPREAALPLLLECHRVLRPGGIVRVVVPDLAIIAKGYVETLAALESGDRTALDSRERCVDGLLGLLVQVEPSGTAQQRPFLRFLERLVRGNAARTGELHRWMYDQHSLRGLLERAGFADVRAENPFASRVAGWSGYCLDADAEGSVWRPGSLYMEGIKT